MQDKKVTKRKSRKSVFRMLKVKGVKGRKRKDVYWFCKLLVYLEKQGPIIVICTQGWLERNLLLLQFQDLLSVACDFLTASSQISTAAGRTYSLRKAKTKVETFPGLLFSHENFCLRQATAELAYKL